MIKNLIAFVLGKRINWTSMLKSQKILKNVKSISIPSDIIRSYRKKWHCFGESFSEIYLRIYIPINGIQSGDYVPENLYYGKIEPILNKKAFALAYADKNFYERYLPEYYSLFPKTYLRGINGNVYDYAYNLLIDFSLVQDFLENGVEYILKPASETSGGRNVLPIKLIDRKFIVNNDSLVQKQFIQYLQEEFKNNFVIQQKIIQNPFYADFNQSSLNTVRMFTYRSVKDDRVIMLQSVLRFGKAGSLVDNQAAGGLSIGINRKGLLNNFCVDKWGIRKALSEIKNSKQKSEVPGFSKMKEIACRIANKYFFQHLLGFDFCFTANNEVKLLEINCKNLEINFLQMNNGPLFGEFTDEVVEYCLRNKKSVVLDFEV